MVSIQVDDDIKEAFYGIFGKNLTVKCFECMVSVYLYWIVKKEIEGQKVMNFPLFVKRLGKKEVERLITKFDTNILNTLKTCGVFDTLEESKII